MEGGTRALAMKPVWNATATLRSTWFWKMGTLSRSLLIRMCFTIRCTVNLDMPASSVTPRWATIPTQPLPL